MIKKIINSLTRRELCERAEKNISRVLAMLPAQLECRLRACLSCREDYPLGLSEIRLRAGRGSYVVMSGENIYLDSGISSDEAEKLLTELCRGSRYAFEESIKEGYLTFSQGVRVGIIAEARYSDGSIAGISRVSGFVFRFPSAPSEVAEELFESISERCEAGMLIFSPPAGGKTAALRSLAAIYGAPPINKRVVIVDERCEFCEEDYKGLCVDIIRGFKKKKGIELALRSLSPEIIIVDELIGEDEAAALLSAGRGGVRLLASVHGSSIDEVIAKPYIRSLVDGKIIDSIAGIFAEDGKRRIEFCSVEKLKECATC